VNRDGPMSPGEVAAMGQILAGAMDYLAGQQVVRLDLKPSNVVMADRGPVIIDLGVAFSMDRDTSDHLTATNAIIGTPNFMAPELFEGGSAGPLSDIYALGMVMYFGLAGKTPWGTGELHELFFRIISERIDMTDLVISTQLRDIIASATAKKPADRFSSAAAMRDALLETPEWHSVNIGFPETIREGTVIVRPAPPSAQG
jgi:serine/threonine protein kinase